MWNILEIKVFTVLINWISLILLWNGAQFQFRYFTFNTADCECECVCLAELPKIMYFAPLQCKIFFSSGTILLNLKVMAKVVIQSRGTLEQ